jgi:hypothetical protein
MNRQDATYFLKELLVQCSLDSDSFILLEPNPKDTRSIGYTIRIKTVLENKCRGKLREITKKYNLAVIEEQNQIIVYKPKSNHAGNLILK